MKLQTVLLRGIQRNTIFEIQKCVLCCKYTNCWRGKRKAFFHRSTLTEAEIVDQLRCLRCVCSTTQSVRQWARMSQWLICSKRMHIYSCLFVLDLMLLSSADVGWHISSLFLFQLLIHINDKSWSYKIMKLWCQSSIIPRFQIFLFLCWILPHMCILILH